MRAYDKAGDVGGTWWWNRYPGARFHSEAYIYQYLFDEDLYRNWSWSEKFPRQPEIERWMQYVTDRLDLRRDISREIRRVRPQRMLIPSPEIWWRRLPASHPDHRAAGEAALAAIYPDARNPFAHPELLADEGLEAWAVPEIWLMAAPDERIDHVVDITDTVGRKVAALQAHASQTSHMTDLDQRIRSLGGAWAHRFGLTAGRFAEVFQIVTID